MGNLRRLFGGGLRKEAEAKSQYELGNDAEAENRYDLSPDEMLERTAQLLLEREPVGNDRFVCYMLDGRDKKDGPFLDIARSIEREVFERHFEGNDAEGMIREYSPYEAQSVFFMTVDTETGQPAGAIRIIRNGAAGFKTLEDLASPEFKNDPSYPNRVYEHYGITDKNACWDVATAAVRQGYGGGEVSSQLYRGMWIESQREGIEHFFSVIDRKPYELMQFLGFPFETLYETDWTEYVGSAASLPVHGDAPAFDESVRRQFESLEDGEFKDSVAPFFRTLGYGDTDGALQFLPHHANSLSDHSDYAA